MASRGNPARHLLLIGAGSLSPRNLRLLYGPLLLTWTVDSWTTARSATTVLRALLQLEIDDGPDELRHFFAGRGFIVVILFHVADGRRIQLRETARLLDLRVFRVAIRIEKHLDPHLSLLAPQHGAHRVIPVAPDVVEAGTGDASDIMALGHVKRMERIGVNGRDHRRRE